MKRLAALLLAFAALSASAEIPAPTTVGAHLYSAHFGPNASRFQDRTPGLYARWANGFTLGAYRNSVEKASAYAAWTFEPDRERRVSAAITLGAIVGGYEMPVVPMVVPSVALRIGGGWAARAALIANPKNTGAPSVHFSVERRF
jgi:hypothetical protein